MKSGAVLLVVLIIAASAAVLTVSHLEERDSFCLSCHLAPETQYVAQAQAVSDVDDPFQLPDLASFHYWASAQSEIEAAQASFRCIDCHRGDGRPLHRVQVFALAAMDTVTWALGRADEAVYKGDVTNPQPEEGAWPGPEAFNRAPHILNSGCENCHAETLTLVGFANHFHNRLPAAVGAYARTGTLVYPDGWAQPAGTERLLQNDDSLLTCLDCHRAHVPGFESGFFLNNDRVVLPACELCHMETGRGPLDLVN